MTHVTCRLTAQNRDQLRNPMLDNRVWATFTFLPSASELTNCETFSSDVCVDMYIYRRGQWPHLFSPAMSVSFLCCVDAYRVECLLSLLCRCIRGGVFHFFAMHTGWSSLHNCMLRKSASVPLCYNRRCGVTITSTQRPRLSRREHR